MLHLALQLTLPPLVEKSSAAAQYLIISKSFGNAYFKKIKKNHPSKIERPKN